MSDHPGTGLRRVVLLGSTGSIGTQAIEVIERNRDQFTVVGICAGGTSPESVALLAQQAVTLGVEVVAVHRASAAQEVQLAVYAAAKAAGYEEGRFELPKILGGADAASEVAAWPADVVLNGMTGSIGLAPTLAALKAGSTLALANKESLIVGGPLVTAVAAPGQIVPVDSEHSALAQCLRSGSDREVRRLILTASGGPFRGKTRSELADVSPAQALEHPTWAMGPVVTTNSATLMNKGLEVIEAHLLFGIPFDRIDVVVHPQSIVHSMVEFVDGSVIAQASPPDMRLPIALGLAWPDRVADAISACDWTTASQWNFEPVDHETFPALRLARLAGEAGGTAPAVLNAANEVCVAAFLAGELPFLAIVETVTEVVQEHLDAARADCGNELGLDDVISADAWARSRARQICGK